MGGEVLILVILAGLLGLAVPAIRKTLGLLVVIGGVFATATGIGAIVGIPMILFGGLLMFL